MHTPVSTRLQSIDALRGLVILFMLVDHVRETFYLHMQVSDPMDTSHTDPALFFTRTLAHLCAPVFVLLTGLSAFLYGEKHSGRVEVSRFLVKRGLFLVVLEVTLVNFAWTFQFPPGVIYLQVIWVIGLSMLALAALVWLPRAALLGVALLLIAGHNLLEGVQFVAGDWAYVPWAILHDRGWIEIGENLRLRTSYPLLPWIGVIAFGYAIGPWFSHGVDATERQQRLLGSAAAALACFVLLRVFNGYGDRPWATGETGLHTLMNLLNITKYPPSLLFLALTLGVGLMILLLLERRVKGPFTGWLAVFGAAPMFFYLLHLYALKLLYLAGEAIWGANQGSYFGFDGVWAIWLCALLLTIALYFPVRWFAQMKARRRDIRWLKYL